jgi:hypothetical protein
MQSRAQEGGRTLTPTSTQFPAVVEAVAESVILSYMFDGFRLIERPPLGNARSLPVCCVKQGRCVGKVECHTFFFFFFYNNLLSSCGQSTSQCCVKYDTELLLLYYHVWS